MDYNSLYQLLVSKGLVDPALFHGSRTQMMPVPQTPAPEAPQEYMPPITPAMPPLPTRKPAMPMSDPTQGYIPAGGFGATGPATGTALEARLQEGKRPPSSNPFEGKPSLWQTVSGMFEPHQPIRNMPERSALDKGIEQALMMGLPMGRALGLAGAATKVGKAGFDAAFNPAQWMRMGRSNIGQLQRGRQGYVNVADDARPVAGPTRMTPAPEKAPQTLAQELQAIHRAARRNQAPKQKDLKLLRGEALEKRKQYYRKPRKPHSADLLEEKGRLDAGTHRLIRK